MAWARSVMVAAAEGRCFCQVPRAGRCRFLACSVSGSGASTAAIVLHRRMPPMPPMSLGLPPPPPSPPPPTCCLYPQHEHISRVSFLCVSLCVYLHACTQQFTDHQHRLTCSHRRRLDQTAFGFAFVKTCVAHVPDIVIEYIGIPHHPPPRRKQKEKKKEQKHGPLTPLPPRGREEGRERGGKPNPQTFSSLGRREGRLLLPHTSDQFGEGRRRRNNPPANPVPPTPSQREKIFSTV